MVTKACKFCGKEFKTYPCEIKKGNGKYCSKACYALSLCNKILRLCEQCGIEFRVRPSQFKRGEGKFCSEKCMGLATRGEKHPNYKGGYISIAGYKIVSVAGKEMYEHRHVMEQRLGRKLTEDEIVHHIDGVKGRNDPENLQVMTKSEHVKLHQDQKKLEGCFKCNE